MTWRPETGWDEQITNENMPMFKYGTQEWLHTFHGVQIGADAMLEALRKQGTHFEAGEWTDDSTFETTVPGTEVFIPDDEKEQG